MSKNIIYTDGFENASNLATESFVSVPTDTPEPVQSGIELGWEGAATVIILGALLLKTIHGPGSR